VAPTFLEAQAPPNFKANQVPDPYVARRLLVEKSTTFYVEPGVFLEATWRPHESLSVIGGVRLDYQSYMQKLWVDPRLSVLWTPVDWLTLKGGAAMYHQPPDYRVGQLSPVFGNPGLQPEGANHFTFGAETRFTEAISLDVNVYYKQLTQQVRQVLTSGLGSDVNIPGAETRFSSEGYGRAYGAELLLRHKLTKNFFGWVAYSLSRFERDGYGGQAWSPGPLDQPHNLIVVASYQFPFDIVVGGRFRYASGPLVTPVVASLYDVDGNYYYPLPGQPWSVRLPDFVQFDVRIDKRFVFDTWTLALYLDVQNVTNAQNPEGLFYSFNYTQKAYVYGIPILPSLGVRGEL
jgi:outer membrane receptor protein involved in Fe transport